MAEAMKKTIALSACLLSFSSAQSHSAGGTQVDGEEVFNNTCSACHSAATAARTKAPAVHDIQAWGTRLSKGIDAAVASAKKGKGGMPPKGLCMDCSDAELKAAIEFMSTAE